MTTFTNDTMQNFALNNLIVESIEGGLLLGPSHDEGGIKVFAPIIGGYQHIAEFEGWEFLLNPGASIYYPKTFHEINNYERDKANPFEFYDIPSNVKILDCRVNPTIKATTGITCKLLLMRGTSQKIINKYSTKFYLGKLNDMNRGIIGVYNHVNPSQATKIDIVNALTTQILETYNTIKNI